MATHKGVEYSIFTMGTTGMGQSRRYEIGPHVAAAFRSFVAAHLPEQERTRERLDQFTTAAMDYFARSVTDTRSSQVVVFRIGESEARAILMLPVGVTPTVVATFITNNLDELLDISQLAQAA